ncbi:hypothetical protein QLX08_006985 [Tetragonisca angustula]|uniref:Uncharacterized protein n=1 Tax=Tetragonisca angustula TaxID=166442 RepID=A0AAW0ZU49_9HYME
MTIIGRTLSWNIALKCIDIYIFIYLHLANVIRFKTSRRLVARTRSSRKHSDQTFCIRFADFDCYEGVESACLVPAYFIQSESSTRHLFIVK